MADAQLRILITAATQDIKKALGDLQNDFQSLGKSLQAINANQTATMAAGFDQMTKASNEATKAVHQHIEEHASLRESVGHTVEAFNKLFEAARFVAGGFLGIEAIAVAKEFLDVAARTETLGIALRVVGTNAGYTIEQLEATDKAVQKLGITAQDARQSIATLLQANVSLDLAKPLARAAQDLAVISGLNSSQTFTRLIQNIEQLDTVGLRFMGIMVDQQSVMERAALATGRAITETAQRQILANAVLAEGSKFAGAYEAAMASAGKQLTSFPRYIEEFKDALGALGQQVFLELILGARDVLEALTELAKAFTDAQVNVELFGEGAEGLNAKLSPLAQVIHNISAAIVEFIHFLEHNKEAISEFGRVVKDAAYVLSVIFLAQGLSKIPYVIGLVIGNLTKIGAAIGGTAVAAEAGGIAFGAMWRALLGPVGLVLTAITIIELLVSKFAGASKAAEGTTQSFSNQSDAVKHYIDVVNQRIAKEKELIELQKDIEKASFKQATARTPDEKTQANAEVAALQKRKELLDKANTDLIKEQQRTVAAIDSFGKVTNKEEIEGINHVNEMYASVKKAAEDAKLAMKDLNASLTQVGSDFTSFSESLSLPVLKSLGAVDFLLTQIGHDGVSASAAASTLLKALEDIGTKIKTPEEFDLFVKKLESVQQAFLGKGVDLSAPLAALKNATKIQVDEAVQALNTGGERIRQQRIQIQRQAIQDEQVQLRALISLHQQQSQRVQLIDKAEYDVGLRTLEEYYGRRLLEIQNAGREETKAAEEELRAAYVALNTAVPSTPAAARAQRQVDQALLRTQQVIEQTATKELQTAIQLAQQKIALYEKVAATQDSVNEATGNRELAIRDAAARALTKELAALAPLNDAHANEVAIRKSQIDLNTKLAETQSKLVSQKYDEAKAELDLQKAILDAQTANGSITTLDNEQKQNDLLAQRLILLRQERDEQKKVLDDMVASGTFTVDEYNAIAQKINGLGKEMVTLSGQVQHLGADLQKTFVDSFSTNLTGILNRTKSFKDGIKAFFTDINNSILGTLTKNIGESISKSLSDSFGGGSGNFFDEVIGALTGKKAVPKDVLGTDSKPMVVQLKEKSGEAATTVDALNAQKTIQEVTRDATVNIEKNTKQLLDEVRQRAQEAAKGDTAAINRGTILTGTPQGSTRPGFSPFSFSGATPSFNGAFDTAATKYGLDAYGLNGDALRYIARKESNFNPNAVSSAGAIGVMQVMPATAEKLGYSAEQMKDAATNIEAGAKLFKEELDRYQGDVDKALAAYNAGDPAVDRAIRKANSPGGSGDFKDYLPNETKDYVATLGTSGALGKRPVMVVNGPDGKPLDVHAVDASGNERVFQGNGASGDFGPDKAPNTTATGFGVNAAGDPRLNPLQYQNGGGAAATANGNSFGDFLSFVGPKVLGSIPVVGPALSLINSLGGFQGIQKALNGLGGQGGGFTPNANGVPRQGPYTPFEGDYPAATEAVQQQVDASATQTISQLGASVESSFGDIAQQASSGGLGIKDFFTGFGDTLNQMFSSLTGNSGSGGGGGLFASLFSSDGLGSLFAAEGGYLRGPLHSGGGIPVEAEGGEFIVNRRSTAMFLPLLHAINNSHGTANMRMPGSNRFDYGGMVEQMTPSTRAGIMSGPNVTVVQHIHTADINSFRRNQDQLAVDTSRSVNRALRRNT